MQMRMSKSGARRRSSRSRKNWPFSERSTSTRRRGRELQQLPADFRADAAGAAGDQQHAIVDPAVQFGHVQPDRLAAEQVLDRDFAGTQVHRPAQQLLVTRQDPDVDLGLASLVHQLADLLARQLAGRDEDVRDVVLAGPVRRCRPAARSRGRRQCACPTAFRSSAMNPTTR